MIILGVDLGKVRTGLAVCDRSEIIASPLETIEEKNSQKLAEKIAAAAQARKAERIVIGLPKNMDGSEGESAQNARAIGELVEKLSALPVDFMDERGTTITAHNFLNETNTRGKKRKAAVDAVAATVILQNYMEQRRIRGEG